MPTNDRLTALDASSLKSAASQAKKVSLYPITSSNAKDAITASRTFSGLSNLDRESLNRIWVEDQNYEWNKYVNALSKMSEAIETMHHESSSLRPDAPHLWMRNSVDL